MPKEAIKWFSLLKRILEGTNEWLVKTRQVSLYGNPLTLYHPTIHAFTLTVNDPVVHSLTSWAFIFTLYLYI